jgi:hypothetical protein
MIFFLQTRLHDFYYKAEKKLKKYAKDKGFPC